MKKCLIDYIVPIEQEDLALPLKTIIDSTCPNSETGRVVKLIVTMEIDENERFIRTKPYNK